MDIFLSELTAGLPDFEYLIHIIIRLFAASLLGALIGLQRELAGKPAGLRTHTLVTLGTSVFVVVCLSGGMGLNDLSRVIQGIITGIGFIGAGAILKLNDEQDIKGLTTSASIWMCAAIGIATGIGSIGIAIISTLFTLAILSLAGRHEAWIKRQLEKKNE